MDHWIGCRVTMLAIALLTVAPARANETKTHSSHDGGTGRVRLARGKVTVIGPLGNQTVARVADKHERSCCFVRTDSAGERARRWPARSPFSCTSTRKVACPARSFRTQRWAPPMTPSSSASSTASRRGRSLVPRADRRLWSSSGSLQEPSYRVLPNPFPKLLRSDCLLLAEFVVWVFGNQGGTGSRTAPRSADHSSRRSPQNTRSSRTPKRTTWRSTQRHPSFLEHATRPGIAPEVAGEDPLQPERIEAVADERRAGDFAHADQPADVLGIGQPARADEGRDGR